MARSFSKAFKVFFALSFLFLQVFASGAGEGNIESLRFREADIRTVIRSIAVQAYRDGRKVNIVTGPEVTGLVTVELEDVSWQDALRVVLRAHNYSSEWVGSHMILVGTAEEITKRMREEALSREAEATVTESFRFNFAKAEDLTEVIKGLLSNRGRVAVDKRTNAMIITDTPSHLERVRDDIKALDAITPQVLIEAKIVETSLNAAERLGLKWDLRVSAHGAKRPITFPWPEGVHWGTRMFPKIRSLDELKISEEPIYKDDEIIGYKLSQVEWDTLTRGFPDVKEGDFSFGTIDFSQAQVMLEALSREDGTNVVSNPRILTLDSQAANITVATEWPIPKFRYHSETGEMQISDFTYKPIGVVFNVIPQINEAGYITMRIEPEVSSIVGETAFAGTAVLPLVHTQSATTNVMIKDGETLVIGGLIKSRETKEDQKVPFLGNIPFLGRLFSHRQEGVEQQDLLVFITPRIIPPEVGLAEGGVTKEELTREIHE